MMADKYTKEQRTPGTEGWDSLERSEKIEVLRERMLAYRRCMDAIENFFYWGGRLGILEGGIEYALSKLKPPAGSVSRGLPLIAEQKEKGNE